VESLVVFYSRTGRTKKVAESISSILGCDVEEIFDTKNRAGILGYLRSGWEASRRKTTVIREIKKDPALYDIVIIGTPLWSGLMSSPIRTYLLQNRDHFKDIAFFCTYGGSLSQEMFNEMGSLCGKKPRGLLGLKAKELMKESEYLQKVTKFIDEMKGV